MKLNLRQKIELVTGEHLLAEGKPVQLAQVLVTALGTVFQGEQATGEEKFQRGALAGRIKEAFLSAGEIELSDEEARLLKYVVGRAYAPFIVYAVWNIIDVAGKSQQHQEGQK